MPLAQALQAASNVATGDVRAAVLEVKSRVERGDTLSTALAAKTDKRAASD
jgi:type II secretory pathway component PulF